MHAAGYLEGALTARLIPQHYSNWYSRAFKDELEPGDPAGGGVSAHLESLLFGQLEWARKRARNVDGVAVGGGSGPGSLRRGRRAPRTPRL